MPPLGRSVAAQINLDELESIPLNLERGAIGRPDAADLQREVERLMSLGAWRVAWDYPPDPDFIVLSDPDGNVFCVVDGARYTATHS
ncbi:VOC family protein [Georgenia sp. 10Sc9-8]|uniref:VOC family protein n=1 Tax=Georgenia halotolerans TaxID=3028317 RepID=A0ABT5TW39_9MICO|nr:VOC family protein [Georgenia halotolerans]